MLAEQRCSANATLVVHELRGLSSLFSILLFQFSFLFLLFLFQLSLSLMRHFAAGCFCCVNYFAVYIIAHSDPS